MTLLTASACPFPCGYAGIKISICYAQVTTIPLESFAIKLKTVVRDEDMRDSKPSDNIFPNKSLGIYVPDISHKFD